MELFALSDAATTTIVALLIWAVLFPAFVTAVIAFALVRSYGEKLENDEHRRGRKHSG
jgi:hypothetical protein